jgi:hypothetical protein
MIANPLEMMIQGYVLALTNKIDEAKRAARRTGDPFELGRTGGFYLALSMLLIRARSCGIDLRQIGLEGIDPDDLV